MPSRSNRLTGYGCCALLPPASTTWIWSSRASGHHRLSLPGSCHASGGAACISALLLALCVRLPEYRQAVHDGRWQQASQFCLLDYPIRELADKTLGIVGYGELGRSVARVAEAFGMRVLLVEPCRPGPAEPEEGRVPLPILLPRVDDQPGLSTDT